ncbi:MAG: T9SS type A sorting domain-containing protein [Cryomorphaceae bacterium]|nr:T9SS type A sorting domain-containing protein [Cryomorphaceae bacterium]
MKTLYALILSIFISQIGISQVDCVDESLINPDILCTADWTPVCGCNGVTYSNGCVAVNYGGVTSYTDGECGTMVCQDLGGIDFGLCDMVLGYAFVDGGCSLLSGCGWTVNNVDYSPYFFDNEDACFTACSNEMSCFDLTGLDFGECAMPLGIALVDGQCVSLSGCGWTIGFIDYSPFFFESIDDCQNSCANNIDCMDVGSVDFGFCDMPLGIALVNGECIGLSGCGWEVNGIDYSPFFYNDFESCQFNCDENACMDVATVDFGDCEMFLGYAILNGSCEAMGGCGWIVDNVDYSPYFYVTYEECISGCPSCINTLLIDPSYPVSPVDSPVCGCNNVTYLNADVAQYEHGVSSYTPGECTSGVDMVKATTKISVSPNPTDGMVVIAFNSSEPTVYRLYSIDGTIVRTGNTTGLKTSLDLTSFASGIYFLEAAGKRTKIVR